jgi:hypothetical protein
MSLLLMTISIGSPLKKQLRTALQFSAKNHVLSDKMTESWAPSIIAAWKATLHSY